MLNKSISWRSKNPQSGAVLMEALVSILIFSIGIIALMALQAVSIKNSIDAKYRSDASYFANQIIAQMWVDRANIDSYANYTSTVTSACTPGGTASSLANVTTWATQLAAALPGAVATKQSIVVSTPITGIREVTVMVCWKTPQSTVTNNFVTTTQINI